MSDDKLVRMANQIAGFFRPYPEAEAAAGIRDHIESFWTRKMRDALGARLGSGGGGLDPLVRKALIPGPVGPNPIDKETAGPEKAGALGSDAG